MANEESKRRKISEFPEISDYSQGSPYLVGNTHDNADTGTFNGYDMISNYLASGMSTGTEYPNLNDYISSHASGEEVTFEAVASAIADAPTHEDLTGYDLLMFSSNEEGDSLIRANSSEYFTTYISSYLSESPTALDEYLSDYLSEYLSYYGLDAINKALSDTYEEFYPNEGYRFLMYYEGTTVRTDGKYYLTSYISDCVSEYISDYLSGDLSTYLSDYLSGYLDENFAPRASYYLTSQLDDTDSKYANLNSYISRYLCGMSVGTGYGDENYLFMVGQSDSLRRVQISGFLMDYLSNHAYDIYELISEYINP